MTTAIATLQREQDQIARAPASGPLIVQGGPGTGKTVVALHRVAYLLFTHQQMADQAVLVLGPSSRFLRYIEQVLPALGETAVVSATPDTLVPGLTVERFAERRISEIKGRATWQPALEQYVAGMLPEAGDLAVPWESESYLVPAPIVRRMLASATQGRSYHQARAVFFEQLAQILADLVAERRVALLTEVEEGFEDILARFDRAQDVQSVEVEVSEEEIEELRVRIHQSPEVAAFVAAWWPDREPGPALRQFLRSETLLQGFLSAEETTVLLGEPTAWSAADVPLFDAVADLLGDPTPPQPQGEFIADRARAQRSWVYGHVVIDEAQELSEMQWQMVLRRCPTRSITAVGDIDQTEASHQHTTWSQAVGATLGDRWTAAELTICYRTPHEVMALTGPVLEKAGSHNAPPRAVRSSGIAPWEISVGSQELVDGVVSNVRQLQERWSGGTVGVIAPRSRIQSLKAALDDVPVLTATESKGLEWDATLLVDAQGISAEPRGWNGLYVALTRCTQELGQVRIT